jgi:p-aminobenzoyl-glutamate transporter AbgT
MIASAQIRYTLLALALVVPILTLVGTAHALEKKPYRIDWTRGSITQVVCDSGAYFTIRKVRGQEKYVVQERVNVSAESIDEAAGKACTGS